MSSNPLPLQQPGGAVDVERVLDGVGKARERGGDSFQEGPLALRQLGDHEPAAQRERTEVGPGQTLVQVARCPVGEPGIYRLLEREGPFGDRPGRGDDDHQRDLGLQQENLYVLDRGRVQGRCGDGRQQVGHLGQRRGGHAHRLVDLAAHRGQLERETRPGREGRWLAQHRIDVLAVARVRRHPPGRGMRVVQVPELLEGGQLVADGRGAPLDVVALGQPLGPDGLPDLHMRLDHSPQQHLLSLAQHAFNCRSRPGAEPLGGLGPTWGPAPPRRCGRSGSRPARRPYRPPRGRRAPRGPCPVTRISASGLPIPRNCTDKRFRDRGSPPAACVAARATWAIEYRPWRMLPGRPTPFANSGSMWIGLKSPDAPA